ncbi:MAG: type II secretion system protein [Candidatus Riflebacteria bacterium]|nr:type II secretion system protein [Candidatus Riflebacteria bacterium]
MKLRCDGPTTPASTGQFRSVPRRCGTGFTMVELLVTMTILISLVVMASAVYSTYVRDADIQVLKQNLFMMRSAIQQFYLDHGRYPLDGADVYGNRVTFLDNATSELVHGVRSALDRQGANNFGFPKKRVRYLPEIPIDPTTNLVNWQILKVSNQSLNPGSVLHSDVVTNVLSANPEFAHL